MQNVVYACAANMAGNPTGPNGEIICDNIIPPPPPPTGQCDRTNPTAQKDPACIVVTGTGFDLQLKKYINTAAATELSYDAQPGAAVSVNTGDRISYLISVTNSGPQASSGVTTVQDILPVGVTASGSATGVGWSCAYSGVTLTCISSQVVGSGATYPLITVPVIVTATAGQSVTNIAAVDNPLEANRCMLTGSTLPATDSAYCTRDPLNSDPAVLTVPGGSTGGSNTYYVQTCVNSLPACSTQVYGSLALCQVANPGKVCHNNMATCTAVTPLTCSGAGGPPPGSTGNPGGSCGDGVLGSSAGEECDVV
jgi:uncharacterized repeat protein (TIGR01451 family)